jgi:hypothetical protein
MVQDINILDKFYLYPPPPGIQGNKVDSGGNYLWDETSSPTTDLSSPDNIVTTAIGDAPGTFGDSEKYWQFTLNDNFNEYVQYSLNDNFENGQWTTVGLGYWEAWGSANYFNGTWGGQVNTTPSGDPISSSDAPVLSPVHSNNDPGLTTF